MKKLLLAALLGLMGIAATATACPVCAELLKERILLVDTPGVNDLSLHVVGR